MFLLLFLERKLAVVLQLPLGSWEFYFFSLIVNLLLLLFRWSTSRWRGRGAFTTRSLPQKSFLPFFLPIVETGFACLGVCLPHRRIEWEILENKVFSTHHLFRQPPREYVEYIRLELLGNRTEILHGEKRFTTPLSRRNIKKPIQPVERGFLHPFYQLPPFILAYIQESKACQPPNNVDLTRNCRRTRSNLFILGTFNDWLGANRLSGCTVKPAHRPLTSTCPLTAPLVESGRLVTN